MGSSTRINLSSPTPPLYCFRSSLSLPPQPHNRLSLSSPRRCFSLITKYNSSGGGGGGRDGSGGYGGGGEGWTNDDDDRNWWFYYKRGFMSAANRPKPAWFRAYIVSVMVLGWFLEMKTGFWKRVLFPSSVVDEKTLKEGKKGEIWGSGELMLIHLLILLKRR